jgi:Rad51
VSPPPPTILAGGTLHEQDIQEVLRIIDCTRPGWRMAGVLSAHMSGGHALLATCLARSGAHAKPSRLDTCPPADATTALAMAKQQQQQPWRIRTSCPALDQLLGGGVARGAVTEFCGVPGVGKTQLGCAPCCGRLLPCRHAKDLMPSFHMYRWRVYVAVAHKGRRHRWSLNTAWPPPPLCMFVQHAAGGQCAAAACRWRPWWAGRVHRQRGQLHG